MEALLLSNNINKNVLQSDLKFLVDNIEFCGGLDFRLLPFQKLNKNDFNKKYWNKLSNHAEDHIDVIGAYHIISICDGYIKTNNITQMQDKIVMNDDYEFNDEAHIIYKLDNGYWVYTHLYSAYSGLVPYGVDDIINYTSKDLDELIKYGIARKHWKLLGINRY